MRGYLVQLGERVVSTYVTALAGLLLAPHQLLSVGALRAAAWAAVPAALQVAWGGLARLVGDPGSPAMLPGRGR